MRAVVPYAASEPKTRLADVLSADERGEFAAAMLDDVLAAIRATGHDPEILATEPVGADARVTVDERPLTEAVNAVLAETVDGTASGEAVAVVMADLALVTPDALERLFATDGEVVLAPGRGGGTNALVARHPEFRVDYHGTSYLDHLEMTREVGAEVEVVDSHRLATDVDEREDLAEVLIHGEEKSYEWLKAEGFSLASDESRVGVVRE